MAILDFDATTIETSSFDALPTGVYEAVISESKMQETKSGTGSMLVLTFDIISGEYTGRKLWEYLNIENPNAKAVEIARQTLAMICKAINITRITDSSELHDRPMLLTVRATKQQDGTLRNDIRGYKPVPTHAAPKAPAQAPAMPPPPTKSNSPWARS